MKALGDFFEHKAQQAVRRAGLRIACCNYRAPTGEIDIIAIEGTTLVFIEVRARSNSGYVGAAASVTVQKQRRLLRTAQHFLQRHRELAALPSRFDVIAFEPRQSPAQMRWIRSAFTA